MKRVRNAVVLTTLVLLASPLLSQESPMSFFVTSRGPGDGGNLGGLEGADAHCQMLAAEVGRGSATWRAYLSQSPGFRGPAAVNARDRIGAGPWYNANGVMIAANVADLHGDDQRDRNNIRKPTALTEQGDEVKGSGDQPNEHDILTGSDSHGRVVGPVGGGPGTTCNNWTSNSDGAAIVGHHDRLGGPNASWNSVHFSRGCSQENLVGTGGAGLFYCFAID